MPRRSPSLKRLRSLCAEVHPDDGSDPRLFFRKAGSAGKPRHKALQLCRQVLEIVDGLLAGQSTDEVLGEIAVVSVDPAPDPTHLLITVAARSADRPLDPGTILASLDRANGWLRFEVASAITRKRVPFLSYRVVEIGPGLRPGSIRIS